MNYTEKKKKDKENRDSELRNINGKTYEEYKRGIESDPQKSGQIRNSSGKTYEEYLEDKKSGKKSNEYDLWKYDSNQLIKEYDDYSFSGKYQSQEAHDDFYKRIEKQLKQAANMREKYGDNVDQIDAIVERLSEAVKDNNEGRDYYSQWEDDETYQQFLQYQKENEGKILLDDEKSSAQKKEIYDSLKANSDFNIRSGYSKTGGKGLFDPSDDVYEYINNADSGYKQKRGWGQDNRWNYLGKKGYDYITDDERKNYNYIYAKEGKKAAEDYLKTLGLTKRMTEAETEKSREYAKEHPVLASARTAVTGTLNAGAGYLDMATDYLIGKVTGEDRMDPYSYANLEMHKNNAIREQVSEDIGNGVGSFLYGTGMSMADFLSSSAAAAALSQFGIDPKIAQGLILSSNAAAQGIIDAKERGVSDGKALLTGTLQGAAEMVFEKFSIENFNALKATAPENVKTVVMNILKGSFTESSEEFLTTITNTISDWIVNRDLSAFNYSIEEYMNAGMSEEEARKRANADWLIQLGLDALGGGISGGIMSAGGSALGYMFNRAQNIGNSVEQNENIEQTGENITENEQIAQPVEDQMIQKEDQVMPEEIPWEEAPAYEGEQTTAEKQEVAPAQPEKTKTKAEEKKETARADIDTILQNGKISDGLADAVAKNENMRTALEEKTGVKVRGTEKQQKNTVKAIVESYARTNGSTENSPVALSDGQNASVRGKGVQIIGLTEENGSNPKFKDSNGNTYKTEDVVFSKNEEQKLYSDAAKIAITAGEETANAMVKGYKPEYSMAAYSWGFDRFYKAGRNGVPLKESLNALEYAVKNTDAEVMTSAWNLGNQARMAENQKVAVENKKQTRKGKGTFEDQTRLGGGMSEIARLVANRTGIDIIRKTELDHDANAAFIPSAMTMLLSEKAQNEYTALIHEMGEFGLAYDREGMKSVQETFVKYWAEKEGFKGIEDIHKIVKDYQERYSEVEGSKTKDQAMDEIVNDALGGLFSTDTGVDEFIEWLKKDSGYNKTEQRTVIERIIDMIDKVVEYLKNIIKDSSLSRAARQAAQLEEQHAHEIRQMFLDVLDQAVENANTTGEYETEIARKFSLNIEKYLEQYTEKQKEGWKNSRKIVLYENENQLIDFVEKANKRSNAGQKLYFGIIKNDIAERVKNELGHDIKGYNCALYSDNVRKIFKDHGNEITENLRGQRAVVLDDFLRIPEIICTPDTIEDGGMYNKQSVVHFKKDGITIVGVISKGALDLYPQTMYINKKNRSLATATDEQAPVYTPETTRSTASSIIISDDLENATGGTKFSLKEEIEETKNLVAVHNLDEKKLMKTIELGGFPMPSIAVTKADIGHSNFGDITVVFKKDTIDPKNRKNKVYGADAWTPTFPRVEYETNMEAARDVEKKIYDLSENLPYDYKSRSRDFVSGIEYNLDNYGGVEGMIESAKTNYGMKAAYLASQGQEVKEKIVEVRKEMGEAQKALSQKILDVFGEEIKDIEGKSGKSIYENYGYRIRKAMVERLLEQGVDNEQAEAMISAMNKFQIVNVVKTANKFKETGGVEISSDVDWQGMRKEMDARINDQEYESWLRELLKDVVKSEGLPNGKDPFTPSGNRRSFKDTHYAFNVENIVKAMLAQSDDVRNVSGFNGIKSIRAVATEDFKSIQQIKDASGKIENIDTETYEKNVEELNNRLDTVLKDIAGQKTGDRNIYIDMDTVGYCILEACSKPTTENIKKTLTGYQWKVTDIQAQEIADIINAVKDMPVNMFEAKPQRVVNFGEVVSVIVPDNASTEMKNKISDAGMQVVEYVAGDEESRLDVLNSLEDIKFSLPDAYDELKREHENVLRENETFKQNIDYLEHLLGIQKGISVSKESVEKAANKLYRKYKSSADKTEFVNRVSALFQDVAGKGGETKGNFLYLAEQIMRPVLEKSQNNLEPSDYAKGVLKEIKSRSIKVDALQKKEAAYHWGSYNDFRRKNFGRANFSENGTPLDTLWKQWSEMYPELFDPEISPVDQPMKLTEIIDSLKEDYVNENGFNLNDAVSYAAMELMNEYMNMPEVKALSDDQSSGEMRRNYWRLTNEIKKEYREKYESQIKELKQSNSNRLKRMSDRNREQLLRQQAKFNQSAVESRNARLERQAKKKFKDRIVKNTKDIVRMFEDNTDKRHVPEVLRNTTMTFLQSMEFAKEGSWATNTNIELQNRLNVLYRKFSAEEKNADGSDFMMDIDPDFLPTLGGMIEELEASTEIKKISDMSSEQLKNIDYLVNTMKRAISTANKLIGNKQYEKISQMGDESIGYMEKKKAKKKLGKYTGMGDELLNMHMLDSRSFFNQMGNGARSIYKEIRDGFNKRTWKLNDAKKYMEEVIGSASVNSWTGKHAKIHEFDYDGQKFGMTDGQLMCLYELSKRPQAMQHMMMENGAKSRNGGFVIDVKSAANGQKLTERRIKIDKAQLQEMLSILTPKQKKIADEMQRFLANNCSEWGNEVSMILYGYKKFGEKTYWPIKTSDNFNKTNDRNADNAGDNSSLYAIRNQGMTKNLVKNASNPIVVGDIFDVFTEHVTNMANYNAFVVPLTDAMKWYNYRSSTEEGEITGSIKEEMERAFGNGAKRYFINFIKDVNGEVKKGVASEISDTFMGKYKAAAVAANIRVIVQQPTAYFRASAVIDPKYMAEAVMQKPAIKEMQENSAIALWKSWGYFETGIGQSMKQVITGEGTALEKVVEMSMVPAGKADDIAWGYLWNAVKAEVKDHHKDMDVSSKEFLELVAERFDEVIDQTQVVDSVLHRSQIMRSNNGAVKMAVSFMAESTKNYNLLRGAVEGVKENNNAKTRTYLARCVAAYAVSNIATAIAASFVDVFRDDDEEKEWAEKYIENFWENVKDNLNPFGQIPYLKEIGSFLEGYDSSRLDMAGISSLVKSGMQIEKYLKGASNKTPYGLIKSVIRGLSQTTGIPMYNALRDTEALVEQFTFAPIDENVLTGKTVRIRLLKAMRDGNEKQLKKYLSWYDEQYKEKIAAGKTDSEARAALKSSITSQYKDIYKNASVQEKIKIKNLLLKISVNGKQLYKDYDWSSWDKEE